MYFETSSILKFVTAVDLIYPWLYHHTHQTMDIIKDVHVYIMKNQSTLLLLYQDIDQNWNIFNMFMYL